ncbi:MAG: class I SAM-dependent methyltransferase [Pseudolabrys sp.]|nr:class I SAM-dependent methyltransferase [Pseudolabrys sp.]MBV9956370.1 class I SAM-dependent methyltransferase [Pseudolabrys sp.]
MDAAGKRLSAFRDLLAHLRELLALEFGFVLWDGSSVPAGHPPGDLAVVIADEGVVAAVIRRPRLETLLDLWVAGRIDLRGGTVPDLIDRQPRMRSRILRQKIDKGLLLRVAGRFLLVPDRGPHPLRQMGEPVAGDEGNEANIQYHYDVSNAFYALFLDPELVYSCAYFKDWGNDLATAQRDKLDMICRKLRLAPGDTLLDVGCGWGALICHAAKNYGVRAHGITLARQQFEYANAKIAALGLQDRVTVALNDYASVQGEYDKIASIGMFEHVGIDNHDTYFNAIYRLLKPRGLYLHHAITRRGRDARAFRRKNQAYEAFTRYIFPGGELDHIAMSVGNLERLGFEVHDVENWREHYRLTCRHWHDRLVAAKSEAVAQVGEPKTRLWILYLAASSYLFASHATSIFQTLASRRDRKQSASGLPPTRADLYR